MAEIDPLKTMNDMATMIENAGIPML